MTTERPADDMDALLAWLKEQALEAHTDSAVAKSKDPHTEEDTYNRVIAKIENSRVNQRPHLPQGWDEV